MTLSMTTTDQIRRQFLDYFASKDHREVASSSLVPAGDPTLLFTNAGMNQFKDVFLDREQRGYKPARPHRRSVCGRRETQRPRKRRRTADTHVQQDARANFSLADFKAGAVEFAWELLTKVWKLDVERLWFTVFEGGDGVAADDEAAALWVKAGARPERVLRFGKKDNLWSMGDTGPCGPC